MINWASQPPSDDALPHLPLKRVPCRGVIQGAITCTKLLGVWTHFMGRRTLPCVRNNCNGCESELPKRYEAYVSLWTSKPSAHIILALTPRAARELESSARDPNDLRGLIITVQRMGQRANGSLTCRVDHNSEIIHKLPAIPELQAHMLKIWGLDQSHLAMDHPHYKEAVDNAQNWEDVDRGS